MKLLFFVASATILYTYIGYPLGVAALARVRFRPWTRNTNARLVSVVMPVHNGMHMLPAKMKSLCSVGIDLVREIIVVCDGCTDGSVEWLGTLEDRRVKILVLPEQSGKASALRLGMAAATCEFLLFVDVRPQITGSAIRELLSNFADPAVGCVAGELHLHSRSHQSLATAAVSGLYWRYEQWIRNNEAAFASPVGVYGGFYAVRRSLATLPPHGLILDDMFQPLSIIRQGFRSIVDAKAVVHDTWPAATKGEFQRKVRTLAGNFQLVSRVPWTLSARNRLLLQFVSHKLLRLVVPYCFTAMLVSSCLLALHSFSWMVTALVQITMWAVAILALRVCLPFFRRAAGALSALLVLNVAAVRALWVFICTPEPLWKIWTVNP